MMPNKIKPAVSIIINAHNEGLILHKTLRCVAVSLLIAKEYGINSEVIIIADKVDEATKDYIEQNAEQIFLGIPILIEYVGYGDLGLSRNHGVRLAKGEYIGNIDGDDLWGKDWVAKAVDFLSKEKRKIIVHQQVVINFETKNGIWHVRNSTDKSFNPRSIIEDNWWQSSAMAHRDVYSKIPYRATLRQNGFSFEDWLWNNETLLAGYEHKVVPGTVWFYRRKTTSMLTEQISGLVSPNDLMTPRGLDRYEKNRIIEDDPKNASRDTVEILTSEFRSRRSIPKRTAVVVAKGGWRFMKFVGKRTSGIVDKHAGVKRYLRTIYKETEALVARQNSRPITVTKVDPWVIKEWRDANEFERELFPSKRRVASMYERKMMTMGIEQRLYWDLAYKLGEDVEYLLVVPYLRNAGAYLVGINYVKAFSEIHPRARIAVIATESLESVWRDKLPDEVGWIEPISDFFTAPEHIKTRVLAKLFVQMKPRHIHLIHSQEGFRAFRDYGSQISYASKMYVSLFNYDYTIDGEPTNAFVAYSEQAFPYLTRIFTDNEWIVDDSIKMYAVPRELFSVHRMPLLHGGDTASSRSARIYNERKLRVLWAARIASQKRPDILYEIACQAHKRRLPIEFIVYGEPYNKTVPNVLLKKITQLPNIKYMGGFMEGIPSLPIHEFDVYLSTSESEGTPNALIEAQSCGMVSVAPRVGGIPETIVHKKTGILIDDFSDVGSYLDSLEYLHLHRDELMRMSQASVKKTDKERSWISFIKQVTEDIT